MSSLIHDTIDGQGFFECIRSDDSALPILFDFISSLGPSSIRVEKLHPRNAHNARHNSLSANHGTGRFPPHTDFALRSVPPRYIALFCPISRLGATTLYAGDKLRATVSGTGTFRVATNFRSYSASFSNSSRYGKFYRYNADLMRPLDQDACLLSNVIEQAQPDHYVDWGKISWVIIDNWCMLHGRQAVSDNTGWLWRLALEIHK